jgi:hypothetical protein
LKTRFSLGTELNVTVNVSDQDKGLVKLNTIYPGVYPFTGIYFKNVPIQLTAIPRPGYRFVRWEGTINSETTSITYNMASGGTFRAVFEEAAEEENSIVINEINYSSSVQYDTKDWTELLNNGTTSVDLSGWTLIDSGSDSGFVFSPGTIMLPGSYLVICRDLEDFKSFNSNVQNAVGDMEFKLASEGEIVRLFDDDNNLVDQVNYGTSEPWPTDASGTGRTIELKDPLSDNSIGENWQTSDMGGTPGAQNSQYVPTNKNEINTSAGELSCFPNPFRDYTTVTFGIEKYGNYRLEISDMQGRTVKVLAAEYLAPGTYWIDWTGENVSEGVYTLRLSGNNTFETLKIVKIQ